MKYERGMGVMGRQSHEKAPWRLEQVFGGPEPHRCDSRPSDRRFGGLSVRTSAASRTDHGCWPMCRDCKLERGRRRSQRRIPDGVRAEVFNRDGHRCQHCGTTERLTLDHIIPFSGGGTDDPDNLQVLCGPCNSRKGDRL